MKKGKTDFDNDEMGEREREREREMMMSEKGRKTRNAVCNSVVRVARSRGAITLDSINRNRAGCCANVKYRYRYDKHVKMTCSCMRETMAERI